MTRVNAQDHCWTRSPLIALRSESGTMYLLLMASIVLMGVAATVVGKQWSVAVQRDKEAELLFRANQIKSAIEAFAADHAVQKATRPHRFPLTLKELTEKPKRHLRKVYTDPMTGEDFEVIRDENGIRGVRSRSKKVPFGKARLQGARSYRDIAFLASVPSPSKEQGPEKKEPDPLLSTSIPLRK